MQGKDHKEGSIIGLALGVIVAALTTWLVMLLRQRTQPPSHPQTTEAFSEGMDKLEVKPISTQDNQMESAVAPNLPAEAEPISLSMEDAVGSSAKKTKVWSLPAKYMIGAGLVILILWLFYFSRGSIILILFAGLLSLLSGALIDFLKKRFKMRKGLAVTVTYVLIVVILIAIPVLVLPAIISSISSVISIDWQTLSENVVQSLDQTAIQASTIPLVGPRLQDSLTALSDLLQFSSISAEDTVAQVATLESMAGAIGRTLGRLATVLGPIISGVVALAFMLLMSLQMVIGGGNLRKGLVDTLPSAHRDEINSLLDRVNFVWKSFLRGQVLLMFVMGVAVWLLNVLLGTRLPLYLGLLSGLLELIPTLGPFLAFVPAVFLALVFGSTRFVNLDPWVFALILSAGYLLLTAIENQLLVPRIMGSAVNLPPLVVLIGMVVGGSTLGIAGIFLAVPVMATGKEVFLYLYGKVLETEEDLSQPETKEGVNRSFRKFLQSTTTRIRGWFGGNKK